jgi:hypothetical protein
MLKVKAIALDRLPLAPSPIPLQLVLPKHTPMSYDLNNSGGMWEHVLLFM